MYRQVLRTERTGMTQVCWPLSYDRMSDRTIYPFVREKAFWVKNQVRIAYSRHRHTVLVLGTVGTDGRMIGRVPKAAVILILIKPFTVTTVQF